MKRRILEKRWDGIARARELLDIAQKRELTADEIEELKRSHTGLGGLSWYDHGQFFTPKAITDFMVNLIEPQDGASVLEFACGAGAFLDSLYKKNPNLRVVGIELCGDLAEIARICYPRAEIIHGDTLELFPRFERKMDFVIGNPPFGKASKYDGFVVAKGRLEEYFLEVAVRCLKEGGDAILVMPDGILSNSSSKPIRQWLLKECYYLATISLPQETFYFSGTSVKTSIIYFKKKYQNHPVGDYPVFMAICRNIGWDKKGVRTGKCDLDEIKNAYLSYKGRQFDSILGKTKEIAAVGGII